MAALPYIQLYVADYLADTAHLTTEEHGAYLLLIFNYWQTGKPIPKNRLARIARLSNDRWTDVEQTLNELFIDDGETWAHKRIESDLAMVAESQAQRAAAGKASAESRKRQKTKEKKQSLSAKPASDERKPNETATTVERPLNDRSTNKDTDTDTDKKEVQNTMSGKPDAAESRALQAVPDSKPQTPQPKPEEQAIEYLNKKTGRDYRLVESNLKLVRARFREGFTLDDLKAVVDRKVGDWTGTKMDEYLRPATLFNAEKFNQYIAQARDPTQRNHAKELEDWLNEGQEDYIDGEWEAANG
jgi:uncharacterized phage protein (TIGR02220 family)